MDIWGSHLQRRRSRTTYDERYREKRAIALKGYPFCRMCKRKHNLQAHHWRYPDPASLTSADLTILCQNCHIHLFHEIEKEFAVPRNVHINEITKHIYPGYITYPRLNDPGKWCRVCGVARAVYRDVEAGLETCEGCARMMMGTRNSGSRAARNKFVAWASRQNGQKLPERYNFGQTEKEKENRRKWNEIKMRKIKEESAKSTETREAQEEAIRKNQGLKQPAKAPETFVPKDHNSGYAAPKSVHKHKGTQT